MRDSPKIVAALLVAAAVLTALWLVVLEPSGSADYDYPEVAPLARGDRPSVRPQISDGSDAVAVELWIDPLGVLDKPDWDDTEELAIESRDGDRPVTTSVRFVSGICQGLRQSVSGSDTIRGLARGWHRIEVKNGGRVTERLVRVPRRLPLVLDWSGRSAVEGRVHAYRDGAPIAGAAVVIGGKSTETGADGRFRLDVPLRGGDVPARLSAQGFGSYQEVVGLGSITSLDFVLEDSWRIDGVLHLPATERATTPRIAVLPDGGWPSGSHAFPFDWTPFYAGVPVGPRGHFVIRGLPLSQSVTLGVLHSEAALVDRLDVEAPTGGRRRSVTAHLVPKRMPVLAGRVVAAKDGTPVLGAVITSSPGKGRAQRWGERFFGGLQRNALPEWARYLGATSARSDADGRFVLGLPWRTTRVRLSAPELGSHEEVVRRSARRIVRQFELGAAGVAPSSEPAVLVVGFTPNTPRKLRVTVRWAGTVREQPFLHDATTEYRIQLGGSALVDVRLRQTGKTKDGGAQRVRVRGSTPVTVGLPARRP